MFFGGGVDAGAFWALFALEVVGVALGFAAASSSARSHPLRLVRNMPASSSWQQVRCGEDRDEVRKLNMVLNALGVEVRKRSGQAAHGDQRMNFARDCLPIIGIQWALRQWEVGE